MELTPSEIVGDKTIYRNSVGRGFFETHFNCQPLCGEDAQCAECGYTVKDHMALDGITNSYGQIVFVTTGDPQVVVCKQCVQILARGKDAQ